MAPLTHVLVLAAELTHTMNAGDAAHEDMTLRSLALAQANAANNAGTGPVGIKR